MTIVAVPALRGIAGHARWLAFPCALGLSLPLLVRTFPKDVTALTWLLDLAAHWQFAYGACWLALCLFCAIRSKRWLWLAPLAALPLFTASESLPSADADEPALVVAAANVYVGNRDPSPLVAWLRTRPADVVVLSELSDRYSAALSQTLGRDYPYRALHPRPSPFGIGIVSRLPLREIVFADNADGIPTLTAKVRLDRSSVRIVAAHPMPPHAPQWHDKRDASLRAIAGGAGAPSILAGDLNATPWSSGLIGAARAGLFRATSLAPTWPGKWHGVFGIPIDHILASAHWRKGDATRGPDIGSDHFPVRVALHWADGRDADRP